MKPFLTVLTVALTSCSSFPPGSLSAGFMGASVTVSTPGWTKPVPVVASPAVSAPVLMVPQGTIGEAQSNLAQVTTNTATLAKTVPIMEADVVTPVLAVPEGKP
jgi:hypothetical protein